ncbi:uncharacterized protein LOC130109929 [Lampris incognitus]|uniref:uncharacterized protein LOC130109929 n=1 Tax=Lampris incognitus TaxID=2546036 RepID=UPI0024B4D525|nr:uncharacterized protein LOC130109929 [Lampris incognitus]
MIFPNYYKAVKDKHKLFKEMLHERCIEFSLRFPAVLVINPKADGGWCREPDNPKKALEYIGTLGTIADQWSQAEGVLIPKEENSNKLEQFRAISPLGVEGKIFSVLYRRMTDFLLKNAYIDTLIEKGGIPGVPMCHLVLEEMQAGMEEEQTSRMVGMQQQGAWTRCNALAMLQIIICRNQKRLIRPSSSQVAAGFFFVKKKDGGLRPCIDYRQLNDITIKNKYPLPLMSSTLEPLTQATVFTKLDLRNAYHLVRIRKGDEWKTAFKTPRGHYEYLVMPFGLTNAPAVFQALMNDILRDMLDQFVVVYLDDILIFSRSLEEHVQHVRQVLERLLRNRLFVKAEKCLFHSESVDYLGFIVEGGKTRADPRKIKAVVEWPDPKSRKELQSFLGFANFYRRFVRNYSSVAEPLTRLTSPSQPFVWSPAARSAFLSLKERFTSAPVLLHPDPKRQFIVEVDASDTGLGAVLSQRSEADQKVHPCAFFSRRFLPAEETVVKRALRSSPAPSNVPPRRLFVPDSVRSRILKWGHTSQLACHPGVHRTFTFIARRFWWPTMRRDVKEFVMACTICARSKASHQAPAGLLQPLPIPSRPWSHVALDFVSGLPPSQGNTVILTVVDRFSKGVHLVALPKLPSASETADLLMSHVFRLHGLPKDILSDRGPQFVSRVWRAFCKGLGASVSLSSGYHPQTNGQTERMNQSTFDVLIILLIEATHYRQLNDITVKNKYPLPLMSAAFEPLTHSNIFIKLDLRSAYHLGLQPSGRSSYLHPPPLLLDPETAFQALKSLFPAAPVLIHPVPTRQFIVEVDASDTGIGAVLFQQSEEVQKTHPCAFLSRRFTPAERNYDIGNRSCNTKADALSRLFLGEAQGTPDTILPPRVVLEWGHSSHFAFTPGAHRTLSFIRRRFWWPSMEADTKEFVTACTTCARTKTADLLVTHVVRLHGIPQDIVSDRGTRSLAGCGRPSTNGQAERVNQYLEAALRCVTTSNPASWSKHLPWVE